jgi:hypothetical protein
MSVIQKEWDSLVETADKTTGQEGVEKYGLKNEKLYRMLDNILENRLSKEDMRVLASTCDQIPERYRDRTDFQDSVVKFMIKSFARSGDRESLVALLSTRFMDIIGWVNIEYSLVYEAEEALQASDGKKGLRDSITVLGEAYKRARLPDVRRNISFALRRAFTGSGIQGKNDDEFVANAMQWYEKEKRHLALNLHGYKAMYFFLPYEAYKEIYKKDPLLTKSHEKFTDFPPLFIDKKNVPPDWSFPPPSQEK